MKPGEILDHAFRRQYGLAPSMPAAAGAASPQIMSDEEHEKLERIAATQMLTEAQSLPAIGANDLAAFMAVLSQFQNGQRR